MLGFHLTWQGGRAAAALLAALILALAVMVGGVLGGAPPVHAQEAALDLLALRGLHQQALDRDITIQACVLRQIDDAHSTSADLAHDVITFADHALRQPVYHH